MFWLKHQFFPDSALVKQSGAVFPFPGQRVGRTARCWLDGEDGALARMVEQRGVGWRLVVVFWRGCRREELLVVSSDHVVELLFSRAQVARAEFFDCFRIFRRRKGCCLIRCRPSNCSSEFFDVGIGKTVLFFVAGRFLFECRARTRRRIYSERIFCWRRIFLH